MLILNILNLGGDTDKDINIFAITSPNRQTVYFRVFDKNGNAI